MRDLIPVNTPLIEPEDIASAIEALESGWISSEGPAVRALEAEMAELVGQKYGVAVSSGTAALDIAIESLGLKAGDEVVLPSFAIISCLGQILRSGATPVFIDSCPITWNLKVEDALNAITPRTKALVVVHTYGLPADISAIETYCRDEGVTLIEDFAEQIGQLHNGRPVGGFGDISITSFYANKHITTGEGGMLFTSNERLFNRCVELRNLCFQRERRFVHESIGWNYRLTNVQASIGLAQLRRIDKIVNKKRVQGIYYSDNLLLDDMVTTLPRWKGQDQNIYWVYPILISENAPFSRSDIVDHLRDRKIETRPFFYPLHLQPALRSFNSSFGGVAPVSELLGENGFYLPSGLGTSFNDRDYVIEVFNAFVSNV